MVSDLQQVQQHIGHLVGDGLFQRRVVARRQRLLGCHPLEDLGQLSRLHHQRHRQILGRVKRLPRALGRERAQLSLQSLNIHGHRGYSVFDSY
ncbi:hypothetical protein D3C71_1798080 [compost metagenome]